MNTNLYNDLQEAIEMLYSVFRTYPLRPHVEGCTHCVDPEDHVRLQSKPLRQLSTDDLSKYSWKALTTWGDDRDFRHFLPRILELVAIDNEWWATFNMEVVFSKLEIGKWTTWPEREQRAINDYLNALYHYFLLKPLSPEPYVSETYTIDDLLCAIGQAADDLQPFLTQLSAADTEASLYRIARFIDDELAYLINKHKLSNAFWDDRKSQMEQVINWIIDSNNERLINNALMLYLAREENAKFENVGQYIEIIGQLRIAQSST